MMTWPELTATVWRLLDEHGLLTAFVLLFLEESGLPPLIPGDLLMVLVGVQAAHGQINLLTGLVALEIATVLGGSILYLLAWLGGHAVVHRVGKHVGVTPERLQRVALSLQQHGGRAIVLGRLVPSLCVLTAVAAGVLGFPYRRFLPALAIGGFLHLLIFVLLGYAFGPAVLRVLSALHPPFELLATVVALGALGFWLVRASRQTATTPIVPRPLSERLVRGLLAGLLGAIASTLLANMVLPLLGVLIRPALLQSFVLAHLAVAGSARTVAILIALPYFALSTAWGAVYGIVEPRLGGQSPVRGAVFGLVPLAFSLLVLLPAAGGGWLGLDLGAGALPVFSELVRALAYGLTLGAAYSVMSPHRLRQTAAA